MHDGFQVSLRAVDDRSDLDGLDPRVADPAWLLVASECGWASLILVDGEPAGVLTLSDKCEVALWLEARFQGKGIGTGVLEREVRQLAARGVGVWAKARSGSAGARIAVKAGLSPTRLEGAEMYFSLRDES